MLPVCFNSPKNKSLCLGQVTSVLLIMCFTGKKKITRLFQSVWTKWEKKYDLEETNENEELNIRHFFFFLVLVLSNPLWVKPDCCMGWLCCGVNCLPPSPYPFPGHCHTRGHSCQHGGAGGVEAHPCGVGKSSRVSKSKVSGSLLGRIFTLSFCVHDLGQVANLCGPSFPLYR